VPGLVRTFKFEARNPGETSRQRSMQKRFCSSGFVSDGS
jgi:hypothetical protein